MARQSELLNVKPGEKILEIGTGSGYQALVLMLLKAKVYSIERHKYLHDKTAERLKHLGYLGIRTFYGDGFLGLPRFAPFDKILITAACPHLPTALLNQLKPGGLMVLPLETGHGVQTMIRVHKDTNENITKEDFGHFKFVPMLKGTV